MRVPRDWSGKDLIKKLGKVGYATTRQTGSHVRLTRSGGSGDHHVTVPAHKTMSVGTLNSILRDVANHLEISKSELIRRLS